MNATYQNSSNLAAKNTNQKKSFEQSTQNPAQIKLVVSVKRKDSHRHFIEQLVCIH
ncbi:hypothetical protein HanIR_Chr03g0101311 [Helianthus annuus]|nr:hypothetical protein HanIR_Chr03g0101311 [Helianthus annuus]